MRDNYRRTATDFMEDARTLHTLGRPRNACYLAGYVVESAVKEMIKASGRYMDVRTHDLIALSEWLAELSLMAGQRATKYGDPRNFAPTITRKRREAPIPGSRPKLSCDWDPTHRYDGSRWTDPEKSSAYVKEAQKALDVLNRMLLDGVRR